MTADLSLLTFNIGNPSPERAERQLQWLAGRDEHVLVLTETKASVGCRLLADAFTAAGYAVHYPEPGPGDYGVMIVSRLPVRPHHITARVGYLPTRAAGVTVTTDAGPVQVLGFYVPSRDASPEKTTRKRRWLSAARDALSDLQPTDQVLLLGDLNVLEPDHRPRYPFFSAFEYDFYRALSTDHALIDLYRHLHPKEDVYSWVGRTGDGYRYDHAFCSRALASRSTAAQYLHEPRRDRLSDHSALTVRLGIATAEPLQVTDPTTALAPLGLF